MKLGDVVMTTSIEVRSAVVKPGMRVTFKSKPNTAMVFIACGGVGAGENPHRQAERVLERLGWTSPALVDGKDDGIARAFRK